MTRTLSRAGISAVAALLLVPVFAFAAYDDATLTTDTVLSVNSITVNISGSSALVESITVGSTSFTFTLLASSTVQVTAPNRNQLLSDNAAGRTSITCNSASSVLDYDGVSGQTITVTVEPQSTLCGATGTAGSGSSVGSSGGGGGSLNTTPVTVPTTPVPAETTRTTQTSSIAPEILALVDQLRSLVAILKSLGGTVSPELEATLNAFPTATPASFTRNLEVGGTGDDVRALQQFLNAKGYQIAASGPGSPGNETTMFGGLTRAALAKFQEANGIFPPAGYFGPKTRAFIAGM